MTDADDPLMAYLDRELEQIEEEVGLPERLGVPLVPLETHHSEPRTFNWTYRYTWQEVERGRRYVLPLDRDRARSAQQPVADQIAEWTRSQAVGDSEVIGLPVSDVRRRVRLNDTLNVYVISESIDVGPLLLHRSG